MLWDAQCTCHLNIFTGRIGYIHWTIRKHMGLQDPDKNYEHVPERVINVNSSTVMCDIPVIRDWTVQAKRPDTVLHDKKKKTLLLTDIAITAKNKQIPRPGDRGQQDVESEDKNCASYNWSITKGLHHNLQLLPSHLSAIQLQKIPLMSIAHSNGKCWGTLLWFVGEIWTYQKTAIW